MPVKDPRLVVHVIHRDDMVLAVAPTHPLATRAAWSSSTRCSSFRCCCSSRGRQRNVLNSFFTSFDAHPRIAMELDSSELLKRLICAELGMGFLPRPTCWTTCTPAC